MSYIEGADRNQLLLLPPSIDELIGEDNPVRAIDAFVNSLNLNTLGIKLTRKNESGTAYNPSDMIKLYLYGYLNGIRSSRRLEKECSRNIELMWLLKRLRPKYRTIAYFRARNLFALKNIFRKFIQLIKKSDHLDGKITTSEEQKLEEYINDLEKNDLDTGEEIHIHKGFIQWILDRF